MIRRPPRSTQGYSSAASDVYKRQVLSLNTIKRIVASLGFDQAWWSNITVAAMLCLFLVIQSIVLLRKNKK